MKNPKKYDVIATGEFLADLIGQDFAPNLLTTDTFRRVPGGSPANLAQLGHRAALVACVGDDNLGRYLLRTVTWCREPRAPPILSPTVPLIISCFLTIFPTLCYLKEPYSTRPVLA
jgi:hypothetical protein